MEADAALQMDMAAAHSDAVRQAKTAAPLQTLALIQAMFAVMEAIPVPVGGNAVLKGRAIQMVDSAAVQGITVRRATSAC